MLDRVELRRREQSGADSRIVAEVHRAVVRVDVTLRGKRTKHEVGVDRFTPIAELLDRAAPASVPAHAETGEPVGYEVILSSGMTQSVYRWVASTPATWEPVAALAAALLALGCGLSDSV